MDDLRLVDIAQETFDLLAGVVAIAIGRRPLWLQKANCTAMNTNGISDADTDT